MPSLPPPDVKKGDWIQRQVAPSVCPWAIVISVYPGSVIQVMHCANGKAIKNDLKWNGQRWETLADFGMGLPDRHGTSLSHIEAGPPADITVACAHSPRPVSTPVIWQTPINP